MLQVPPILVGKIVIVLLVNKKRNGMLINHRKELDPSITRMNSILVLLVNKTRNLISSA